MIAKLNYLKRSLGFLQGSLMIVFLMVYCWSGLQLKQTQQDGALFLQASNLVEFVIHDGKVNAQPLQLPARLLYINQEFTNAIKSISSRQVSSSQELFVSFLERNVFYVFISINAP